MRWTKLSALWLFSVLCVLSPTGPSLAASFSGNARVEISDPNGGLSWSNNVGALTVQCWFKLSIPSGFTPTENMTILVNRTNGSTADKHAYHLWYDPGARQVKFSTFGTSLWQGMIIDHPYLDRWYHVAVVRDNTVNVLRAYVDGQLATNAPINVGDSRSTYGVSIGGWGAAKHLYGEVQEVTIYQSALIEGMIRTRMFAADQSTNSNLVGYYRLGYSTNAAAFYANAAPNKPPGTDGHKEGAGQVLFEETDQKGEQSLFDSLVNGGKNAIAPLSGAFVWQQSVFSRPVPGVPFDFSIAYSPSAPAGILGPGWSHSFNSKVEPVPGANTWKLLTWQGGIEVWDGASDVGPFQTRHGEYRGEFARAGNADIEWTNTARVAYRYLSQDETNVLAKGQLSEVRDLNGNALQVHWNKGEGYITEVVDSTGASYRFHYNAQYRLTNVAHGAWQVLFAYTNVLGQDRLFSKTLTNTSGVYSNVATTWRFYYNTNGLLERVVDPRIVTNAYVQYDAYGRRISTTDALGRINRTEYGVPGKRQITTTDAEGYRWIAKHDRSGRVISQQNPVGTESRSTYDDHGNRSTSTDPLGNTTRFAYDEQANVTNRVNALGNVTRWTYDLKLNKPLTETDPLGWTTANSYDAKGNLLNRRDALGTLASFTYAANGLVETQTDANGNTTWFTYNSDGFRIAETDAGGFTKRFRPNEMGWNLAITNALGEVTAYAYDLNGNTVRTLDPLGRSYAGTYDANGNLLTQTDPKGQTARNTYDALNQKTTEVDRGGGTNWLTYTPRGQQSAVSDALGRTTTFQYDAATREVNAVDALGNSVAKVYDANGNAIALIDPLGKRWTKVLDRLNRTVAVTDPAGSTSHTLFDAAGRIRESIGPDGSKTAYHYDGRGRMTNRVDAAGSTWRYDYDGVGNITNITDALGGHYVMVYSHRNERLLERNQDGQEWRYTYDALSRLKTQHQPNGNSETIEYDAGSRIHSVSFSTGRINSFLYDDNDNPVVLSRSGSGPATITQLAYDAMDRVQQCTDAFGKAIRYDYDIADRLTALTYPDGKVLTHRYDALDRLTNQVFQFSAQQAYTNSYAYDKTGRLIRRVYPNGIVQTNCFDAAGRLTGLSHASLNPQPSALNIALSYAHDRNGNTAVARKQGVFQWPKPALLDETSRFTASGRITDRVDALNPATRNFSYRHDASGNLTNCVGAGQTWNLTYDEDNRTTSICWTNGVMNDVAITNRYDALGRRIARTEDGDLTGYVLDLAGGMERILCDLDASRTITAYYIHSFDLTFKVTPDGPDGSLTCYHADAQGNIIALTDAQANTVAEYAYTPYGRSLGSSPSTLNKQPYTFVGSQGVMEELPGLYFMRARYYSAEAGVFLSTDPVKNIGATWVPLAFVYAEGNPLRFNDPNGEFINWLVAGVTAVVGAAVNAAIEVVTQLVENGGDFEDIQWGKVGIAAGIGFIQGGIAGLTMGASIVAQVIVGAIAGAATSLLQTGFNNLTEGKPFVENWQSALIDAGTGAASGAVGARFGGGGKIAKGLKTKPPPLLRLKSFRGLSRPPKPPPLLRLKAFHMEPPPLERMPAFRGAPKRLVDPDASAMSGWRDAFREAGRWGLTEEAPWGVVTGLFADALKQWVGASESYEY